MRGEHCTIQLLWAAARILVAHFVYQVDEFSLKEMRTWDQSKISSSCICVWCESGELGCRRNSRLPCVNPMVKIFSSDRVTFRILSNINNKAPLQKQPTALTSRMLLQKSSTTDHIPNPDLTGGAVNVGCG